MQAWLSFLTRTRLLELALAVALGAAGVAIVESGSNTAMSVLAQHVGSDPTGQDRTMPNLVSVLWGPYYLNVTVGNTIVVYGTFLSALLTLAVLTLIAVALVRRRDRELGACPFCTSRIPHASTHCAYCGSAIEPDRT